MEAKSKKDLEIIEKKFFDNLKKAESKLISDFNSENINEVVKDIWVYGCIQKSLQNISDKISLL